MKNEKIIKIKKTFKDITHEKVIAIIFIFLIFFISLATLPAAIQKVGKEFNKKEVPIKKKMLSTIKSLDEVYQGMLSFKDNFISNKGTYINFNGMMSRLMGQKKMNNVVILNNGHLANIRYEKLDVTDQVKQITSLYKKQKEKNKDFLFVLAPSQISKYEDLVPEEFKEGDYTNYNGDELLKGLERNKIPFIDLRKELNKEGITNEEAFYVTDHHWTAETGFWAYKKIINRLSKDKAIKKADKKWLNFNNYDVEKREDVFLGSSGKRVGKYFVGIDDFSIIKPKSKTKFKVSYLKDDLYKEGSFEEVLCNKEQLEKNYFSASLYNYYSGGDIEMDISNVLTKSKEKTLLIGDSFSNATLPFLSLMFKETHKRDMRHFEGDFESYYKKYNPDIIIILLGENHLGTTLDYDFFSD